MPTIDFSKIGEPLDEDFIEALFDEIGLTLGGAFAVHVTTRDPEIDDFLWTLCRNLDVIRSRALKRLRPAGRLVHRGAGTRVNLTPHPAIQTFMDRRNVR